MVAPAAVSPDPRAMALALAAHADHLDHAAATGGFLAADGRRVRLDQAARERWARDAALFRGLALAELGGECPA